MGTKPLLFKYPLDLTGHASTNLVIDEPHTIGADTGRAFVTHNGPFYVNSVKVVNAVTGKVLTPHTQYLIVQPYQEAAIRTGLDVAAVIYVIDKSAGTDLLVTYQCVGGEFSWSVYALQEMLEALNLDDRPVAWGDIIGKPAAYPPTPHFHDLGDTYGWEYVTAQLEGIRNAILIGDAASHDELRAQLVYLIDQLKGQTDQIRQDLQAHIEDMGNPHQTTKAQVQLGNVDNFKTATGPETAAALANNLFVTPVGLKAALDALVFPVINAHIQNIDNPHQTTKAQVQLGNVDNFRTAQAQEVVAGAATNLFVTPQGVKAAIDQLVMPALNAHIQNQNNPHGTTAVQVGLGNIPNSITDSRGLNSNGSLLTAKAMFDHVQSGDHDARYIPKNLVGVDGSVTISGGQIYMALAGAWRVIWPPQWQ